MLTIVFKETTNTKELNRELESQNLIPIVDIDFLNDWVDTIKNDEANRKRFEELTGGEPNIENLKTLYPAFTKENHLMVDFYFDRISEEEAIKYGNFIQKHKNCISYIQDGIEFTNRFDLSDDIRNTIIVLNRESNEPEKLPIDMQIIPNLNSGVALMKSMFPNKVWVIFGNVESPKYLKKKIFVDNLCNDIYIDKNGYSYLLVPTIPLCYNRQEQIDEIYERAFELGIRESNIFFNTVLYGAMYNLEDLVDYICESYNGKEIIEKFHYFHNDFKDMFEKKVVYWDEHKGMYVSKYGRNGKLIYFSALRIVIEKDADLCKEIIEYF